MCLGQLVVGATPAAADSSVPPSLAAPTDLYDVVVYGATPAGITAAIAAAREHLHVALLEPTDRIGGMMTSGLGTSDIGSTRAIGGLALDFFKRMGAVYGLGHNQPAWNVTPGVAQRTFEAMLSDANVAVFTNEPLRQDGGVAVQDHRITSVATENGRTFAANVFIDASYEGDLMAQAGVSFVVGREAASQYGESLAGVRPLEPLIPRVQATTLSGSLAPGVDAVAVGAIGSSDAWIQPYTFRLCVTQNPADRAPFPKPTGYDPARYLLLQRRLNSLVRVGQTPSLARVMTITPLPQGKADLNAAGPLSTDLLGGSNAYPNDDGAQRQALWREQYRYEAGLLYYLASDPAVPPSVQRALETWGLCRDEFTGTGNWPPQLYIREARRMVSDFVLTQKEVMSQTPEPDAIGLASYHIDSHPLRLVSGPGASLYSEGALLAPIPGPYEIPYRILVPKRSEINNLLDPVTVSASHVAFASLRMEPQYMVMGEATGAAAALAVSSRVAVQDIDIRALQASLLQHHAILRLATRRTSSTSSSSLMLLALCTLGVVLVLALVARRRSRLGRLRMNSDQLGRVGTR